MQQSASTILILQPAAFGFDIASAASNHFQHKMTGDAQASALAEFHQAAATLRAAGVTLIIAKDTATPRKPDAIFPNNWFTTWPDGRLFLYPMCVPARRLERRTTILNQLRPHYVLTAVNDLSAPESQGIFLEGTGALVFDHLHKTAYANLSARCHEQLARQHAAQLGYELVLLHGTDEQHAPIYHTNVMMAIQTTTAVACLEALPPAEAQAVANRLQATGRQIIAINRQQMRHFAANILEVQSSSGKKYLALSASAYRALRPGQRRLLASDKTLLPIAIPTIEAIGGGSIRCMMAEIFLPPKRLTGS